jgi:2-polyprenyl-3-methyl-5-hydroxy-6-metoxy-1,4-benzoquinol methylase
MDKLLTELGIINKGTVSLLSSRTRDKEDCNVFHDTTSGVIFLEKPNSMSSDDFNEVRTKTMSSTHSEVVVNDTKLVLKRNSVASRRADEFKEYIENKVWVDIGAGVGELVTLLKDTAAEAVAVEINNIHREDILARGIQCYKYIEDLPNNHFDTITLFHVFEHFDKPLENLQRICEKLKVGGTLIIEVPHARDALITQYQHQPFINFTLRSDHLVLHTKESLLKFLEVAGLKDISVEGYQRYGLANHLYWLQHDKPGGHEHFSHLTTDQLDCEYASSLKAMDATDTLIAISKK